MTRIDPFSLTTVPVEQYANGRQIGWATAFVWKRPDQKHFLITNWHVVTGKNNQTGEMLGKVRPETLRTYFNTRRLDFGKVQRDIPLRDAAHNPLWLVHPVRQHKVDLVALPLDIAADDADINMRPINSEKSETDLAVTIGMDVFILGYPFGYSLPGFPIWKRGSIASEPDLVHLADGYLLVDTASRPGMSGAPVIRRSWGTHSIAGGGTSSKSTPQSKFVGVYSGRRETKDGKDTQLGLVWTERDIVDIVSLEKRDE